MLRIGIIGAGQAAALHAAAYAANPDARIVAVVDPDSQRADALASPHGATAYESYEEMFNDRVADAVSVCVPHHLHLPVANIAAEHGVHMLMEKPIANTLEEADQMIEAVQRSGVTMMIGFVHRFRTEVLEAKRLIDEGVLGHPATVLDKFCAPGGAHPPGWVWRKAYAGGGVLMYGGIHAVDRLLWLLDSQVVAVDARAHNYVGYGDVEDGLVAIVEFANGVSGVLFENSPPYGRPGGWSTEIFGPHGAIRIKTGDWLELSGTTSYVLHTHDDLRFRRTIDEFISAVTEARQPSIPASAGRAALEVVLAIYQSATNREPVTLGEEVREN